MIIISKNKVTLLDLYQSLGKIVNKYPYYEILVTDEFMMSLTTGKLLPNIYIDRKNRKIFLKKSTLS